MPFKILQHENVYIIYKIQNSLHIKFKRLEGVNALHATAEIHHCWMVLMSSPCDIIDYTLLHSAPQMPSSDYKYSDQQTS